MHRKDQQKNQWWQTAAAVLFCELRSKDLFALLQPLHASYPTNLQVTSTSSIMPLLAFVSKEIWKDRHYICKCSWDYGRSFAFRHLVENKFKQWVSKLPPLRRETFGTLGGRVWLQSPCIVGENLSYSIGKLKLEKMLHLYQCGLWSLIVVCHGAIWSNALCFDTSAGVYIQYNIGQSYVICLTKVLKSYQSGATNIRFVQNIQVIPSLSVRWCSSPMKPFALSIDTFACSEKATKARRQETKRHTRWMRVAAWWMAPPRILVAMVHE